MPSEDSKGVMKEEGEEESLGSMLQSQKKNLKNSKVKNAGTSSSTPKHQTKAAKTTNKVKKDDDDDDFDVPIKGKIGSKSAKVKKEEDEEDEDSKPISRRARATTIKNKELSKKKKKIEEVKKMKEPATPEQNGKKREKKVYDLPGQKRDPPDERDPLRIFYESLYKQVPNSEIAQIWMMESGLLAEELAQKIFEKKQKKNPKLSSPLKAVSAPKNAQPTSARKKIATSPVRLAKKKTADSTIASKQANKRKVSDESSEHSDDDFVVATRITKKQRAS